jgi:hypothetical protein
MSYAELKAELAQFISYEEFYNSLFVSPCITGLLIPPRPWLEEDWIRILSQNHRSQLGSREAILEGNIFFALDRNKKCQRSNPDYKRFREYYHVDINDGYSEISSS